MLTALLQNTAEDEQSTARGRESRTKKNRTHLSAQSEEDSPPPADGPLAATDSPLSPRVTQIRKRVKDLNWKEGDEPSGSRSASDDDARTDMGGVEASLEIPSAEAIDNAQSDEWEDADVPNANDTSEAAPRTPPDDRDSSDQTPENARSPAEPTSTPPAPVTPESEAEAETVTPLPSTADESTPRTDRTLKRKSRDSVFFASGDTAEDESCKRAKDDPDNKPSQAEDSRQFPSTPPRARSPNKFVTIRYIVLPAIIVLNPFSIEWLCCLQLWSVSFLEGRAIQIIPRRAFVNFQVGELSLQCLQSFLEIEPPLWQSGFSPFGGNSSIFAKYSTPKSPSRTASPSPKPNFTSSGFGSFASKPSPFLSAASRASPTPAGSAFGPPAPGSPPVFASPAPKASVPKPNEAFGSFSSGATRFGTSTPKGAKSPKSDDESGEGEDAEDASAPPKASFDEILASSGDNEEESASKVTNLEAIDGMSAPLGHRQI